MHPTTTPTTPDAYQGPQWQTPAMRQFVRFKTEQPDCLLLFRMGDFYELFGPDAQVAHEVLGITLTERSKGMPMAGVPHHSIESYLRRLVEQGHRVAVCDQVQDPRDAKGVVDRAVTRVLTPGTLVDEALLEDGHENVIAAVAPAQRGRNTVMGVAVAELSTGSFTVQECDPLDLPDVLARIAPAELLTPEDDSEDDPAVPSALAEQIGAAITRRPGWNFRLEDAEELLRTHYGVASLEGFGLAPDDPVLPAAGSLLRYLLETQAPQEEVGSGKLAHFRPPIRLRNEAYMALDIATLRSLEIERTSHRGDVAGSLQSVFGHCKTSMGRRLIRHWLCRPLLDPAAIETRQRGVRALVEDRERAEQLRQATSQVQDVARIGGRVAVGRCTPRDLVALSLSVEAAVGLRALLAQCPALGTVHDTLAASLDELAPLAALIRDQCVDTPPAHLREGGVIRDGVDEELDEARSLQRDANEWLASYQAQIIEDTGIGALKVGYNKVFGYYIEVTKANESRIPPTFIRKQTLKNAERYITPELKTFEDKVLNAEANAIEREKALFAELCIRVARSLEPLSRFAHTVG
ncbi:MAG: DNA mismatch repair protein MutS, partial [Phycisphaerales bacterium]|nr:DNA mismatch repair protein MutS [Phycisphaerales bacterium]